MGKRERAAGRGASPAGVLNMDRISHWRGHIAARGEGLVVPSEPLDDGAIPRFAGSRREPPALAKRRVLCFRYELNKACDTRPGVRARGRDGSDLEGARITPDEPRGQRSCRRSRRRLRGHPETGRAGTRNAGPAWIDEAVGHCGVRAPAQLDAPILRSWLAVQTCRVRRPAPLRGTSASMVRRTCREATR
jgi:hypothetical protein